MGGVLEKPADYKEISCIDTPKHSEDDGTVDFYQVDSFVHAKKIFTGNPAVIYLDFFENMASIAQSHNAPATTFVQKETSQASTRYKIRWFLGSGIELPLCGHGTLAAASILFETEKGIDSIDFITSSEQILKVQMSSENCIEMEFPMNTSYQLIENSDSIYSSCADALNISEKEIIEVHTFDGETSRPKLLIVMKSATEVKTLKPNFSKLATTGHNVFGFAVTARAIENDNSHFVCRYFAPRAGLNEDTATGSIHCLLFPFWEERLGLGTQTINSFQCSDRGGYFTGKLIRNENKILLGGATRLFARGSVQKSSIL
jgi:PhzF family phenazine biosynthesis protein